VALVDRESGTAGGAEQDDPLLRLLPRAVDGDAVAVRAVLFALSPEMTRAARAVLGASDAELDDAVQESLLGLLHALPSFRGECGLRRFANRIAVRTALRVRRRGQRRVAHAESLAEAGASEPPERSRRGPDVQHLAARRKALLLELLDALPEVQAETLALRVVLGYSLEETASATGVPVNTVRSRVRLAREALRARIESEPGLHELFGGEP